MENKPSANWTKSKKRGKPMGARGYHDKREQKRLRKERLEKIENGELVVEERDETVNHIQIGSKVFDDYYQRMFPGMDYQPFIDTLKDKLPVTFRVNPGQLNHQDMVKILKDPGFIEQYAVQAEEAQDEVVMA